MPMFEIVVKQKMVIDIDTLEHAKYLAQNIGACQYKSGFTGVTRQDFTITGFVPEIISATSFKSKT